MSTDCTCMFPYRRNAVQRTVPALWLSGADQAAEAALGQWRES